MYIFFRLPAALKCNVKFLVISLRKNDKQVFRRRHLCPSSRPSSLIAGKFAFGVAGSFRRQCEMIGKYHQALLSQLKKKSKLVEAELQWSLSSSFSPCIAM